MHRRSATTELMKIVLKDEYLRLTIDRYAMTEDVGAGGPCEVGIKLREGRAREERIRGSGVGIVDALYHGLIDHYAPEYPSLKTIRFTGFAVNGRMDTTRAQGADAEAVVTLLVQNSDEQTFEFERAGRSLVAAALGVVLEAAEYFVNSERAFVSVYRALVDARARNRQDLVQQYTSQLAELVNTTSYSEVIERIKSDAAL
ncbi:MAG: hypothetical protein KC620_23220 [Myxococcales bacterium]|nr:hypothetical protein [Myxococcales bacterium]